MLLWNESLLNGVLYINEYLVSVQRVPEYLKTVYPEF